MAHLRIYLAWQKIADGRAQIRRWSPDRTINHAQNRFVFIGFEGQNSQSLAWLAANGEPTWPECLAASLPKEPFMVRHQDDGEFTHWKPKKEDYSGSDEPVAEGLNRFLKKGEQK